MFSRLWSDETGAGMVEYVLLVALVAGLIYATVKLFGTSLKDVFVKATAVVNDAGEKIDIGK